MSKPEIYRQLGVAIHEAHAGRKDTAKEILLQILRQDPLNETAWGWLATVVEVPAERHFCLRKVLEINPDNVGARDALEKGDLSGGTDTSPFHDWTPADQVKKPSAATEPKRGATSDAGGTFAEDPEAALEWVLGGAITPEGPRSVEPAYSGGYSHEPEEQESTTEPVSDFDEPPPFETEGFEDTASKLDDILGPVPALRKLRGAVTGRRRIIRSLDEDSELPVQRWAFVRAGDSDAPGARPLHSVEEPPETLFAPTETVSAPASEPADKARAAPRRRRGVRQWVVLLALGAAVIILLVIVLLAATGGGGGAPPATATPSATPAADVSTTTPSSAATLEPLPEARQPTSASRLALKTGRRAPDALWFS